MKFKFSAVAVATLLTFSTSLTTIAYADAINESSSEIVASIDGNREFLSESYESTDDIRANLLKNDVPIDKIDNLIEKIELKQPWDSFIPGSHYVEEVTVISTYSKNDTTITKKIFDDGSYYSTEFIDYSFDENPIANMMASRSTGISGGEISSGSTYTIRKNCKVYLDMAVAKLAFTATYAIDRYSYDKIISVSQAGCVNYTDLNLSHDKPNEDGYGPATASLSGRPVWFVGGTSVLVLSVGGNGASVYIRDL